MESMGYTGVMKECDRCHNPFPEMKGHRKITKCLRCRIEIGREKMAAAREKKLATMPKIKRKPNRVILTASDSLAPPELHSIYKPQRVHAIN